MNKKKQNILISIISVIGVAIILLMLHIANKDKTLGEDDNTNSISFKVYYENNELVIVDVLKFNEDETLLQLMERSYDIETKVDSVSTIILSIESYTSDFTSSFFSLYIDGVYSSVGAKNIKLTGGLDVEWVWKKI